MAFCQPGENPNSYIADKLQPDNDYLQSCGLVIDNVVRYLHDNFGTYLRSSLGRELEASQLNNVNIKEILKSGSMGKSTALKNNSDIDLIIYLNGFSRMAELMPHMPSVLKSLRDIVCGMASKCDWVTSINFKDPTKFSIGLYLHFKSRSSGKQFVTEMDLLPSLDISRTQTLPDVYQEMQGSCIDQRRYYSAALSRVQKDFVSKETQNAKVKNVIRFLKDWKEEKKVPIKSYFIELLVIHNNRMRGRGQWETFKMGDVIRECFSLLQQCDELTISFTDHYSSFSPPFPTPYLVDPANPFMNVASDMEDMKRASRQAKEYLLQNEHRLN